jgi:hypothetical protein
MDRQSSSCRHGADFVDDDIARAARAKKGSPFLSTEQAAFYLGLSAHKLQQMRAAGTGPSFRRHSRYIRYHIDDLEPQVLHPKPARQLGESGTAGSNPSIAYGSWPTADGLLRVERAVCQRPMTTRGMGVEPIRNL